MCKEPWRQDPHQAPGAGAPGRRGALAQPHGLDMFERNLEEMVGTCWCQRQIGPGPLPSGQAGSQQVLLGGLRKEDDAQPATFFGVIPARPGKRGPAKISKAWKVGAKDWRRQRPGSRGAGQNPHAPPRPQAVGQDSAVPSHPGQVWARCPGAQALPSWCTHSSQLAVRPPGEAPVQECAPDFKEELEEQNTLYPGSLPNTFLNVSSLKYTLSQI